jgi:hypothetical protein
MLLNIEMPTPFQESTSALKLYACIRTLEDGSVMGNKGSAHVKVAESAPEQAAVNSSSLESVE